MKGCRLIHVLLALGLRSQCSRLCWYRPHRVSKSMTFIRSCWLVYLTFAMRAISLAEGAPLEKDLVRVLGIVGGKNVVMFCLIVMGVGQL